MGQHLDELIARAKSGQMDDNQKDLQRKSFAYGNTKIENERISRESINQAARAIKANGGSQK